VIDNVVRRESLPADARSVREARTVVRAVISESSLVDREEWGERAALAVSELVTNAIVHAGTSIELRVHLSEHSLRVEIADQNTHSPATRSHALTAVTGRGLHLVESSVDRWDIETHADGKTVWFEIGEPLHLVSDDDSSPGGDADSDVLVVLRQMPLLIHMAWQEQISALLREYLLARLEDDLDILERHAQASAAMTLLFEQVPSPTLVDDPDEIMVNAVGPGVTADELVLRVPRASVADFEALETLIEEAVAMARSGELLATPTQPEMTAMRQWLCRQVRLRAAGDDSEPIPYTVQADTSALAHEIPAALRALGDTDVPALVADEDNRIVAVTKPLLGILGYDREDDLLRRRVVVVIPPRFHQAHIAGTALHQTNGRSVLLGARVTVPVLRADGEEIELPITIEPQVLDGGLRAYVATFG
jgi:anti-sigma regulatory factor (Ser/Thr protein kinase)